MVFFNKYFSNVFFLSWVSKVCFSDRFQDLLGGRVLPLQTFMVSQLEADGTNGFTWTKFSVTRKPPTQFRNSAVLSPVILVIYRNRNNEVLQGRPPIVRPLTRSKGKRERERERKVQTSGLVAVTKRPVRCTEYSWGEAAIVSIVTSIIETATSFLYWLSNPVRQLWLTVSSNIWNMQIIFGNLVHCLVSWYPCTSSLHTRYLTN
jgi:hypothetical protein